MRFALSREPDDQLALRASIGGTKRMGFYLVFRGDPQDVLDMLDATAAELRRAIPHRDWADLSLWSSGGPVMSVRQVLRERRERDEFERWFEL